MNELNRIIFRGFNFWIGFQTKMNDDHGHLGSNKMLKNVEYLNQKNGNVEKNKTSHCKNENF